MRPVRHPLHCLSLAIFALLAIVLLAVVGTVQAQDVSVTGGAVQSNDAPATYTSLTVSGTGPGGSRSTYSANAPLGLGSLTVSNSGAFNANATVAVTGLASFDPGTVATLTGGTLSAGSIYFNGSIVQSGGNYSTNSLTFSNPITYGPNDSISANGSLWAGSTMTLNKDIPVNYLTVSGDQFGRTGGFVRNGYGYQTFQMRVNPFGHATYAENDSVSGWIWIDARGGLGSFPTSLTLHKNLTTNAHLSLSGTAATLDTNGYRASVGTLQLWQTNQTMNPNVTFRNLAVSEGSVFTLDRDLSVEQLSLGDTGRIELNGHRWTAQSLGIFNGANVTYGGPGGTVTRDVQIQSSTLSLQADLALTGDLGLFETSSVLVTNGHSVTADSLSLINGATLAIGYGEDFRRVIMDSYSGTSTLEANAPLSLSYLQANGSLRLNSFAGSWSGGSYALAVDGNHQAVLENNIAAGFTQTANAPGPVTVLFDAASGRTYVASTPIAVTTGSVAWNGDAVTVGAGDAGSFALDAGGTVLVRGLTVGADSGAGTLAVTSGTLLDKGNLAVGSTGPGTVTIGGAGTLAVTGTITRGENGTINLGPGGTLNVGFGGPTGDLATDLVNDGTLLFDRSNDFTFDHAITGTGETVKLGAGTMTLTKTDESGNVQLATSLRVSQGTLDFGESGGFNALIGRETAGAPGGGSLTLDGGNVHVFDAYVAYSPERDGSLTVGSGTLSANWLSIGAISSATGSLNLSGGTLQVGSSSVVGYTGVGTATVSGGSWVNAFALTVGGGEGTGTLSITGGLVGDRDGRIGQSGGLGSGDVTVTGGTWSHSRNLSVASNGTLSIGGSGVVTVADTFTREAGGSVSLNPGGTLRVGNGGTTGAMAGDILNNGTLVFDRATDSTYSGILTGTGAFVKQGAGRLTLTGTSVATSTIVLDQATSVLGGQLWSGTSGRWSLRIGTTGTGSLLIAGGTVSAGSMYLGNDATGVGSVTMTSGSMYASNLFLGRLGSGTLLVENGSFTAGNTVWIGYADNSRGTVTLNSGTVTANSFIVGNRGVGTLDINGGSVTSNSTYVGWDYGSNGTMTVTGGTFTTANLGVYNGESYAGRLVIGGGAVTANNTELAGATASVTGGSLSTGYTTLYSGAHLAVSGGTVTSGRVDFYDGSAATVSGGRWDIGDDTTLSSGTLSVTGGVVSVAGTLAATGNGAVNLGPGGTLQIGTGGTTGVLATSLAIGGTLAFNRSDAWSHALTISGSGSVVKLGAGTLTLAGTNSYSGGTQVTAGMLKAGNADAFGSGLITVGGGASLDLGDFAITNGIVNQGAAILNTAGLANTLTLGTGTTAVGDLGGSILSVNRAGAVAAVASTLTGTAWISNGGTMLVTGGVGAGAAVVIGPGGTLRVGDGGTSGTLDASPVNYGTIVFDRSDDTTYAGVLSGAGTVVKQGAGRLMLTGTSGMILNAPGVVLDQATTVAGGQLWSGTSGRTRLAVGNTGTGSLVVAGGTASAGTMVVGNEATGVGSVTMTSGSLYASSLYVGGYGTGTFVVDNGNFTAAGNVQLGLRTTGRGTMTINSGTVTASTFVIGNSGTGTLVVNGGVTTSQSTEFNWSYDGSSSGAMTVTGGTFATGYLGNWDGQVAVSGGSVSTEYSDLYGGVNVTGGSLSLGETYIYSSGVTVAGGVVTSSRLDNQNLSTTTVSGGRWDIAEMAIVRSGTLAVTGGVVAVSGTLQKGTFGIIDLGPGGTLQIGTGGTTGVLSTSLAIGGTLAFDRSDEWSHALAISGSGSVVKLGVGTLTLAGTNAYSGGTQVTAGTLRAGNTSSFGTGTIVLSSGATLDLANLTFSNTIVNNGGTILNGAGYDGTQEVTSGTATISGTTAGTIVVDAPGATAEIAGTVTGTVTASNGGTVVITGSVAPTAQVSVGAGSTVSIGNGAAIAQPTLANAGKFAVTNTTGSVALPTAITGTGSFEKTGGGSVQLTGSSSFTGGSTIASGEVVVQNTKALGSGGVTVSTGGRLLVDGIDLDLGGAAVALVTGAELATTSGARVTVAENSDLSGVRSSSPAAATAAILAGTAVSGTLATTWTTSADPTVKSEVLELKTPTSASNPFVLSLSYAVGLNPTGLFLGWNDPVSGDWVNAVDGNELLPGMNAASGNQLGYLGSFAAFQAFYGTNLDSYLGAYGRDEAGRTVWAVVNHNSEFAVTQVNPVPEPGTWALALAGLASAAVTMRRRTRSRR